MSMYEVAILGGGPAGLAAAMFCIRKGMDIQLIAAHIGGKTTTSFNLPDMSEYHVIKAKEQVQVYRARLEYLSHTYRVGRVTAVAEIEGGVSLTVEQEGAAHSVAAERLIVASGVQAPPIQAPGVAEYFGRGLGASAISYSHLLRDRSVCVVGNSDRAVAAAMECSLHAQTVTLVLEPGATHAENHLKLVRARDNVTVFTSHEVLRVEGDEFARTLVAVSSESGNETRVEADAFFLEREPTPVSALIKHLARLDSRGYVQIDATGRTSHPRIYAAGDVTAGGYEQVLVALGAGARAGISAYEDHTGQLQAR